MEFCVSECLIGVILGLYLTDCSTKSSSDMKCPEMYGVNFRTSWIVPRVYNLASERGLANHGIGTPIGRVKWLANQRKPARKASNCRCPAESRRGRIGLTLSNVSALDWHDPRGLIEFGGDGVEWWNVSRSIFLATRP